MDKFGKLIRECRDNKGETIGQLAQVIGCSEAFVRHIESSKSVPVSERLISALKKHYRKASSEIEKLSKSRNRVGKAYYREYRKSA